MVVYFAGSVGSGWFDGSRLSCPGFKTLFVVDLLNCSFLASSELDIEILLSELSFSISFLSNQENEESI